MNSYPSYKDSGVEWIGEIPSGWDKTKIKFHFDLVGGFPFDSKLITNEVTEYPIIRIGNVTSGKVDVFYEGELIDKIPIVENGDYVVSLTGDFSIREWNNKKSLLNQRCGLFKNKNNSSTRYLYYLLPFHFRVLEKTKYFTTLKNLSNDEVLNLSLLNPPQETQTQIVTFLDTKTQKIDELIEKTEQKIELLKEKRTSLINHCVTKGLNPDVEMKDSGVEWIGDIPIGWDFIPLKHICYMKGRIGWKGLKQEEFLDDGDYYLITGHDIKNDKVDWNKCYHISKERYDESPEIMLEEQDLLFTKDGTIGKTLLIENLPKPTSLNSHLLVIRPTNNRYKSKFLQYVFKSVPFLMYVDHNKTGTTFYGVSQNTMVNFRGIFPPLSEQTQIVEYLDEQTQKIDSTIEKETQRIGLLKEYRQSLISEVVTGKVDVRDWKE